jgi:hypothetical protein
LEECNMTIRWIAPICLLLVMALAACGGEETPTPEPAVTPTTEVAPTETPTSAPLPTELPTEEPVPTDTPASVEEAEEAESVLPTPRAVSVLPSPTPAPPLAADPCEEELTGQDAQIAQQFPVMGCPQGAPDLVDMARQPFQHGQMIWRSDVDMIYVLNNDGTWRSFEDTFEEGQPEVDAALVAPEGSFQPIRGFGKVWREQLGGPEAAIGWAVLPEAGINGSVQDWEHGFLVGFGLPDRFVIFDDGRWEKVE